MIVKVFDIVVEALKDGQLTSLQLNSEFRLTVPDRNLDDILERTEHKADMVDALAQCVSGDVSSFSYAVE